MIKAVIFDVDGTMVDSEPLHVLAWDRALQMYDHRLSDLSDERRSKIAGRKPLHIASDLIEWLDLQVKPEEFLKMRQKIFLDLIRTDIRPMPGLENSVKRLVKEGYLLGIGTAQYSEYINLVLDTLQLREYFQVVVTGDEIMHGKPHPETYLTVTKKLGVKPQDCVVIEDAESGIKSAKAAGCYCIAIENQNALKQDLSLADTIIISHDEVTKEFILSEFAAI